MIFFAVTGLVTLLVALAGRLGLPGLAGWPDRMRWGMAAALVFTGVDHLTTPERYLPMMPGFVPWHAAVVFMTGLCEIAGAAGLLVPPLRRTAGILLAVYFVCVFPANIRNALAGLNAPGLPSEHWYYWLRLALQPLAIWWALFCAGVLRWPVRRPASPRHLARGA